MSNVIVGTKAGKTYHEIWCPYAERLNDKSRQEIREEDARKQGYCQCKFCSSVRGYAYKYKREGIVGLEFSYDKEDDALCVRTKVGFWKILWSDTSQDWRLYHMNHGGFRCFDPERPSKELMRGKFHRQDDVRPNVSLKKLFEYIRKHDDSYYQATTVGLAKLPKNTKRQKKTYKMAKKIKKKEEVGRVLELLKTVS